MDAIAITPREVVISEIIPRLDRKSRYSFFSAYPEYREYMWEHVLTEGQLLEISKQYPEYRERLMDRSFPYSPLSRIFPPILVTQKLIQEYIVKDRVFSIGDKLKWATNPPLLLVEHGSPEMAKYQLMSHLLSYSLADIEAALASAYWLPWTEDRKEILQHVLDKACLDSKETTVIASILEQVREQEPSVTNTSEDRSNYLRFLFSYFHSHVRDLQAVLENTDTSMEVWEELLGIYLKQGKEDGLSLHVGKRKRVPKVVDLMSIDYPQTMLGYLPRLMKILKVGSKQVFVDTLLQGAVIYELDDDSIRPYLDKFQDRVDWNKLVIEYATSSMYNCVEYTLQTMIERNLDIDREHIRAEVAEYYAPGEIPEDTEDVLTSYLI